MDDDFERQYQSRWLVSARPLDVEKRISQENRIVEHSLVYGRLSEDGTVTPKSSDQWLSELNASLPEHVIFYIHGFNNPPYPRVLQRADNLQAQLSIHMDQSFELIPLIWPTQKDLMPVNNYFQDQQWADQTAQLIANCLYPNLAQLLASRIHFICHSMGARVLMNSAHAFSPADFDQLFLIAPDVENEALETGEPGSQLASAFNDATVFYAEDDLALRTSSVANLFNNIASQRLGATGPEDCDKLPENVDAVDCDDLNYRYDQLKGHSYFVTEEGDVTPVTQAIMERLTRGC